jgi:zinc protease
MKLVCACLLAAMLQSGPLHQAAEPPVDERAPRFEKLSNGLRICVIEDHALPLVSVQLWFKVGSSFDPPTQPGLTHLAMCALQRAAAGDGSQSAAEEYYDAATLRDACYFHSAFGVEGAPADRTADTLDRALHREAEHFARAIIDRASINAASEVAAARHRSDPLHTRAISKPLLDAMFPAHPYRYPPEFVGDWARAAGDTVLREHIERWFTPTNATLFIIGDVSTDATIAAVRKHFAGIEWRDTPRRADFDPPPDERPRPPTTQPAPRCEVTLAWLTPPFGSFENATIDVLMQRLCNPFDGPLRAVLARAGWSPPECEHQAWRNCGLLTLTSFRTNTASAPSTNEGSAAELTRLIDQEFERIAETSVEVEHLNRARSLAASSARWRRCAFLRRAASLAEHEIIGGDVLLDEYEVPRCTHATAGDIAFAAKLLGATRRVVVASGSSIRKWIPEPGSAASGNPLFESPLAAFVGDSRLTTRLTGWAAHVRREGQIDSRATIELLPIADSPLAWVSIRRTKADTDREALRRETENSDQLDYLSYHGMQLSTGGSDWLVEGGGLVDRVDSVLELALRAVRKTAARPGSADDWRVRCVGGISMDELEKIVRAAIEDSGR